jgi:cyclic nucleotide gated channel, plant
MGFLNVSYLNFGEFCREELLTWALDPHSPSSIPSSSLMIKSCTEVRGGSRSLSKPGHTENSDQFKPTTAQVEAFSLMAAGLRFVATQLRRLHSK